MNKPLLKLTKNSEGEVWLHISTKCGLHSGLLIGKIDNPSYIIDRSVLAAIDEQESQSLPSLTLNQLQELATRTAPEAGTQHWFAPLPVAPCMDVRDEFNRRIDLVHAVFGMAGEAGEAVDLVKKSMFYGKPLDLNKVKEEVGDALWYIAGPLCRALGCTLEELAQFNVDKLRKRYPEKYTDQATIDRVDVNK